MRNVIRAGAAALVLAAFAIPAAASAPSDKEARREAKGGNHNLGTKLSDHKAALRAKALQMKLDGKVAPDAKVVKVAKGQYVELAREATDRVFVVIAEFGNTRHVSFCDAGQTCAFPGDGSAQTYEGPEHNKIAAPNRAVDNSTLWQADYNKPHYENMYFNRMAKFYESQSSGRYSVDGDVTEWVKVPFNEARYGRDFCGGIVCNNTWFLIRDAMAFWTKTQLDAGWTQQQVADYLKTFDVWDRYDFDGDGDVNESDGYIDHFQIVHAGGDQAAGDPHQGSDAIWSHRWYAQLIPIGGGGPTVNGEIVPFGGFNAGIGGVSSGQTIPSNPTGVWVGDYTIQPENGGLGVFAHEYGHDLGLPDLYDTSGNTCGSTCENSTGFWTLMSSGANIGDGGPNGIGDAPTDMGAWEKFQLGWLNYEVGQAGKTSSHKLGPAETNTKKAQGVFVVLPPSANPTTTTLGTPTSPTNAWYSTSGNNLDVTMTRDVNLTGVSAPIGLSLQAWYEIEGCWDYAYVRVSTDGGTTYTNLPTSLSDAGNEHGQNFGNGISGISGAAKACEVVSGSPQWAPLTADLSAYAGQAIKLQIRYWTDGAAVGRGFEFDDLVVTGPGGTILTANAEAGDTGWTLNGFRKTQGPETRFDNHYYLAEYRTYRDYDTSLKTAYNFGFLNTKPDWVEHFPYQDGVLINYWDTGQADNSTSAHNGEGLILPIDSHPNTLRRADGVVWRSRVQTYDSTFGLESTDAITLNVNGQPSTHPSQAAVSVFDDRKQWWNAETPTAGVKNPNTGTQIRVVGTSGQGNFAQIEVRPAK